MTSKPSYESRAVLSAIDDALVDNDHRLRMAEKVERLISSAAPKMGGERLRCDRREWFTVLEYDSKGKLARTSRIQTEKIDRQGRPCCRSVRHPRNCTCFADHIARLDFPILEVTDRYDENGNYTDVADDVVGIDYTYFTYFDAVTPGGDWSYDAVEEHYERRRRDGGEK